MNELSAADRKVLILLSEGTPDREICLRLRMSPSALEDAAKRIEARAGVESEDAGRFYERALKQRVVRLNISLTARFNALMDAIPQAVIVADGRTGQIKEINALACEFFGYDRQELLHLKVEDLVPDSFKSVHQAYRLGFLASVRKREMGYHPPIFGVRKDRSVIEMAIALTATTADDDVMVVCSLRASRLDPSPLQAQAERS